MDSAALFLASTLTRKLDLCQPIRESRVAHAKALGRIDVLAGWVAYAGLVSALRIIPFRRLNKTFQDWH